MPAYYNEDTKKWYCKFYYKDWQGNRKQKKKSGFERKKDALEWERSFLDKLAGSPDMAFSGMVELYLADKKSRVKLKTYATKESIINTWILPHFGAMPLNSIIPATVRSWQENLKKSKTKNGTPLCPGTLNAISSTLSQIFNFAVRFYNLPQNPCNIAGTTIAKVTKKINFWTKEEFDRFINTFDKLDPYYVVFLTLYYTGMRKGELQALTFSDLDLENGIIHINKTYAILRGQEIITTPKTQKSIRDILIPAFLCQVLAEYEKRFYKPLPDTRLFQRSVRSYSYQLGKHAEMADIKRIRIHDIRHSHASLLIELGFSVLLVSERLGHENPSITLNIYAHLFPSKQSELVERLDMLFEENETK